MMNDAVLKIFKSPELLVEYTHTTCKRQHQYGNFIGVNWSLHIVHLL